MLDRTATAMGDRQTHGRPAPESATGDRQGLERPAPESAGHEPLNPKEWAFLGAFLTGSDPAEAARAAGYAPVRAENAGRRFLENPRIRAALTQAGRDPGRDPGKSGRLPAPSLPCREAVTEERILRELCAIAFSDFTGFIRVEDGAAVVTDSRLLSDDQRSAIAGIKDSGRGVEIKLHDKEKALELLVKYLGLFDQPQEQTGIRVEFSGIPDLWAE